MPEWSDTYTPMVERYTRLSSEQVFEGSNPSWGTLKKIFDKTKTFSIFKIIIKQ